MDTPFMVRSTRLALVGLILSFGLLHNERASAQALVNDPPHTIKTVMGWIKAHEQDVKEIQQWRDQLQHYQQQLVSASRLLDVSMPMSLEFEERALDFGMAYRCRHPDGSTGALPSLSQLWRRVAPDLNGDIRIQQYETCQKIVMAENARFNEQVRMLKSIQQRDRDLKGIALRAQLVGTSQGKLETVKAELAQFLARASMDMQYAESAVVAYDGLIQSLHVDQQGLALKAMHGSGGTLLGTIVQGASLKAALQAARQRDR